MRPALARLVPVWFAFCVLSWSLLYVSHDHSFDDADPEILNQAWRLANSKPIYAPVGDPPYIHNAYTPIYLVLAGSALRLTGLSYFPAAAVTFLASAGVFWAFIALAGKWREGAWTGCLFFLIPAVLYNSVRTHPQMLAVAFSVWAFYFGSRHRFVPTVLLSPLFSALAVYTKHSVAALPLAVGIWLIFRNRRWLIPYLLVLSAAIVLPFLWLQQSTGGNFWLNAVTFNQIGYSVLQIPLVLIHHAGPLFLFIGLAAGVAWRRVREGTWELADLYLFTIAVTTVIACGRTGAHTQYVVELCAAVLILLLRATGTLSMSGRDRLIAWQVLFLLVYAPLYIALENGPFAVSSRRASAVVLPLLSHTKGPIISQQGSFALFGAGEIYIQLGHFVNLSRVGLWDRREIIREIEARRPDWVITLFDINTKDLSADDQERFTPDMVEALRHSYTLERIVRPYFLYRPKTDPPGSG
jgi:hypothetical protein